MQNNINTHRIIKLTRDGDNNNKDWRTAFSTIINAKTTEGTEGSNIFNILNTNATDISEFDVNDNIDLLMENDVPEIRIQNNYEAPLKTLISTGKDLVSKIPKYGKAINTILDSSSTLLNVFSTVKNITGEEKNNRPDITTAGVWSPWVMEAPGYVSTNIIEFSYTFNFRMGQYGLWNAQQEVFNPIINLFAPVLPQYVSDFTKAGNLPSMIEFLAGAIINVFKEKKDEGEEETIIVDDGNGGTKKEKTGFINFDDNVLNEIGTGISNAILGQCENYTWTISFGNIVTFKRCYMVSGDVKFSSEVDQYGFPVSGSCNLGFKTITPPALTSERDALQTIRFGGFSEK